MAKKKTDHQTQQMIVLHRMYAQGKANYKKKGTQGKGKTVVEEKTTTKQKITHYTCIHGSTKTVVENRQTKHKKIVKDGSTSKGKAITSGTKQKKIAHQKSCQGKANTQTKGKKIAQHPGTHQGHPNNVVFVENLFMPMILSKEPQKGGRSYY